jgi:hypothetical protein
MHWIEDKYMQMFPSTAINTKSTHKTYQPVIFISRYQSLSILDKWRC